MSIEKGNVINFADFRVNKGVIKIVSTGLDEYESSLPMIEEEVEGLLSNISETKRGNRAKYIQGYCYDRRRRIVSDSIDWDEFNDYFRSSYVDGNVSLKEARRNQVRLHILEKLGFTTPYIVNDDSIETKEKMFLYRRAPRHKYKDIYLVRSIEKRRDDATSRKIDFCSIGSFFEGSR